MEEVDPIRKSLEPMLAKETVDEYEKTILRARVSYLTPEEIAKFGLTAPFVGTVAVDAVAPKKRGRPAKA